MKKRLAIVIAIIAIGGLMSVGKSWSQEGAKVKHPMRSTPQGAELETIGPIGVFDEPSVPSVRALRLGKLGKSESAKTARKIEQLMNQLSAAEEEKASKVSQSGTSSSSVTTSTPETPGEAQKKVELTKQLEAAVAEGFDEDMKVRESELSKLEERLNKLRAQLDRRRKAKSEIIQLEVKVLVNEAAGLGFSGGASQGRRRGYMGVSKVVPWSLDHGLSVPQPGVPEGLPYYPEERR